MGSGEKKRAKGNGMRRTREAVYRVRRRIVTALALLLATLLAYHVVFGRNGVNNYEQKRTQNKALQQQIEQMRKENSQLTEHVKRLKSDPDAIEYEAREKLHYAKPGEVIYTLNQAQNSGTRDQGSGTSH
ncbi:MAG: FtsB family cell division protein [Acidobacteriaceae bacterium]